jgi:hypothetical protein
MQNDHITPTYQVAPGRGITVLIATTFAFGYFRFLVNEMVYARDFYLIKFDVYISMMLYLVVCLVISCKIDILSWQWVLRSILLYYSYFILISHIGSRCHIHPPFRPNVFVGPKLTNQLRTIRWSEILEVVLTMYVVALN